MERGRERERQKPEREKREDRKRRCAGRLRQNWATEHNPGRTEPRKSKSVAWKQGRERERK